MSQLFFIVSPSAARNISIVVRNTIVNIWLTLYYTRPADDGGTKYLFGEVEQCIAKNVSLNNCSRSELYLGSAMKGEYSFYNLQEKTNYYFSIRFRSSEYQMGRWIALFYMTPSIGEYVKM